MSYSIAIPAAPILRVSFDPGSPAKGFHTTLSNTDRTMVPTADPGYVLSTVGRFTGKAYGEIVCDQVAISVSGPKMGIGPLYVPPNDFWIGYPWWLQTNEYGAIAVGTGAVFLGGGAFSDGDVLGIAVDLDALKLWFSHNNVWITGNPAAGTTPIGNILSGCYFMGAESSTIGGSPIGRCTVRGRASEMTGTIPSGFTAWEGF